ncbi:MAG: glycosyltransferase [Chloroflexi bacterium]|nr:glycosyltransferase [Chloroflexota bacterium]
MEDPAYFWLALSSLAMVFSLWVTRWVHSQYELSIKVETAEPPDSDAPLVSVIIPARNEARNIRSCVLGLLRQTYPNIEVIAVDDRSSDSTPQILAALAEEDPRLAVIQGQPLPPGWVGKPHALHQGAQAANGSWLCFIDADTFAHPALIASTVRAAQAAGADLFTIMTAQRLETFWEKVILPLIFTALSVGFSPQKVNDPAQPDAVANGQFLLFRREAYRAIGGHQSVAQSIVEDRDLAQRIKQSGLRLVMADGRDLAETRMYTRFSEIWEGWTKNIFLGLSGRPKLAWLGVFGALLCLLGAVGLPGWFIGAATWLPNGGGWVAGLALLEAVISWAYLLWMRARAARAFDISPLYALTLPLGALIFGAMMATSTLKTLTGRGITWKGRRYLAKN